MCYYVAQMERIGIRELRQHASRWIRRAEGGESFEITDRGRPVARLLPLREDAGLGSLLEDGRARAARGDLLALGPTLAPSPHVALPSQVLAAEREGER
jgi:prevent-host-death family protein